MIAPKKSLGQNFLHDESSIKKIITSLSLVESDVVVEIDPGRGALTKHLLATPTRKVIAIEKDERLVAFLRDGFARCVIAEKLDVIHADFLDWHPPSTPFKLVGNIPFYITGRILRHVLDAAHHPTTMTLLMQKEVAERIVMADGKNSILSTAVQVYCSPKIIGTVKPGAFFPPPSVMSAIVTCTHFANPFPSTEERSAFFTWLHHIFAGKRKTLLTNLKQAAIYDYATAKTTLIDRGYVSDVRAEDMTPQDLLALFRCLNPHNSQL